MSDQIIKNIEVKDAPSIEGLHFRGFRGKIDYPLMIAIINACKDADKDERSETVEDLISSYAYLNNCDPYKDMLFVEVDNETVAYSRAFWAQEEISKHYIFSTFFFLVPKWRKKGLEKAILHWAEDHLRAIAAQHPGDSERYFETYGSEFEIEKNKLFESEGYIPVRYAFSMSRPLDMIPEAELPEGIETRPAKPEHYKQIWQAEMEAFRDHWGYVEPTEKDYQRFISSPQFQPEYWQVAWDGDEVVGMVLNFVDEKENKEYKRKRGYTEGISVRRPWRRLGIAKALIVRSMQMFKNMGMEEVALGVDTQNPTGALRLYSNLGYQVYKKFTNYRKAMK
ncbi:MAG: GNAT family N-acetyltransferase [Chloroflexota bacterium]